MIFLAWFYNLKYSVIPQYLAELLRVYNGNYAFFSDFNCCAATQWSRTNHLLNGFYLIFFKWLQLKFKRSHWIQFLKKILNFYIWLYFLRLYNIKIIFFEYVKVVFYFFKNMYSIVVVYFRLGGVFYYMTFWLKIKNL